MKDENQKAKTRCKRGQEKHEQPREAEGEAKNGNDLTEKGYAYLLAMGMYCHGDVSIQGNLLFAASYLSILTETQFRPSQFQWRKQRTSDYHRPNAYGSDGSRTACFGDEVVC